MYRRGLVSGGGAYEHAYARFIKSFPDPVSSEARAVYRDALIFVFLSAVIFGGVAFLLVCLEKEVPLRKSLETEYGLEEPNSKAIDACKVDVANGTKEVFSWPCNSERRYLCT
jgi:hypothetical protein